jgi:ribosomal protein S24E
MERRELRFEIASKTTPKRDLIRKAVSSSLKVPIERVFVRSTLSSFGTNISVCKVHIYNDDVRGKMVEPSYIQLRNLSREERKQALGAAAAKAAEAKPAVEQKQAQKVK